MSKLTKLLFSPKKFFTDYIGRQFSIRFNEANVNELDEQMVMQYIENATCHLPITFPIDVVYTWVNDQDPIWQKEYEKYQKEYTSIYHLEQFATNCARFKNRNQIRYSIKSVLEYLPFVNKIYIVTNGQIPTFLTKNKKIRNKIIIVPHNEIIAPQYLPTFNSHVIEANLYKIKNLSENFIYFNDDVYVGKRMEPWHFFSATGVPSLFTVPKTISGRPETASKHACLVSNALLKQKFNVENDQSIAHTYIPLKLSTFKEVAKLFNTEIEKFQFHKFRMEGDINLASYLVPLFQYIKYGAHIKIDNCYYFDTYNKINYLYYKKLLKKKNSPSAPNSFCINDAKIEKINKKKELEFYRFIRRYYE